MSEEVPKPATNPKIFELIKAKEGLKKINSLEVLISKLKEPKTKFRLLNYALNFLDKFKKFGIINAKSENLYTEYRNLVLNHPELLLPLKPGLLDKFQERLY